MKYLLCLFSLVVLAQICSSSLPDSPGIYNGRSETFDVGSLIIDMGDYQIEDTTVTGIKDPTNPGSSYNYFVNASVGGLFNLYSYGLAVRILSNKIPVYWSIKSGKEKDDNDIDAVSVTRIHPTRNPSTAAGLTADSWGPRYSTSASPQTITLRGGPLFIRNTEAAQAMAILNKLKSSYTGSGRFESIVIFRVEYPITPPIRHKLQHIPYVFVSTLTPDYFDWATVPCIFGNAGLSMGSLASGGSYQYIQNDAQFKAQVGANSCATMFAEPHFIFDTANTSDTCPRCVVAPTYGPQLRAFLNTGGNFWMQCAGVLSYENSPWGNQYNKPTDKTKQTGAFFSKYGVQGLGNTGNEWGGVSYPNTWDYVNPDLPITQFVGELGWAPGTITSWYLLDNPAVSGTQSEANLWAPNAFGLIRNPNQATQYNQMSVQQRGMSACKECCSGLCPYNNTLPANKYAYTSSAARFNANNVSPLGGYAWALAGHSWFSNLQGTTTIWGGGIKGPSQTNENANLYNGRRMLLNALLTPAVRPATCGQNFCSIDTDCQDQFGGLCYVCVNQQCQLANSTCSAGQTYNLTTCKCDNPSPSTSLSNSQSPSISVSNSISRSLTATPSTSASISVSNSAGASQSSTSTVSQSSSVSLSASGTSSSSPSGSVPPPSASPSPNCPYCYYYNYELGECRNISETRDPQYFDKYYSNDTYIACLIIPVLPVTSSKGNNNAVIIGAVVGSVAGVAILAVIVTAVAIIILIVVKNAATASALGGASTSALAGGATSTSPVYADPGINQTNVLYTGH